MSLSRIYPPAPDGLRIVHLSDLHIGDFMPRAAIRRAVDLANAVKPDLAVLTGDLITSERDPLEDCVAELSRLQAPWASGGAGNHEGGQGGERGRGRSSHATACACCGSVWSCPGAAGASI